MNAYRFSVVGSFRVSAFALLALFAVPVLPQPSSRAQEDVDKAESALPEFNLPTFKERMSVYVNDGKIVSGVTIEGNEAVTEREILSHMETQKGTAFFSAEFSRDLRELYRTGAFKSLSPQIIADKDEGTVQIKLVVSEKPTIRSVTFNGNAVYSDKKLLKHCDFQAGDTTSPHNVMVARKRLEELYRANGFTQATVKLIQGDDYTERDIIFRIYEGKRERAGAVR